MARCVKLIEEIYLLRMGAVTALVHCSRYNRYCCDALVDPLVRSPWFPCRWWDRHTKWLPWWRGRSSTKEKAVMWCCNDPFLSTPKAAQTSPVCTAAQTTFIGADGLGFTSSQLVTSWLMVHLIEIISANFKSYFTKYCVKKREACANGSDRFAHAS